MAHTIAENQNSRAFSEWDVPNGLRLCKTPPRPLTSQESFHRIAERGLPMSDDPLRAQLVRMLDWEEAHVGFDKAVDGLSSDKRGALAPGLEHSIWQLVEHMRIAQEDILDFCVNPKYVHSMKWPEDYWPKDPAPANAAAWDECIASFKREREKFKALVRDTKDL